MQQLTQHHIMSYDINQPLERKSKALSDRKVQKFMSSTQE